MTDEQPVKALQSHIEQLTNEKNALLDYIDENLDKFKGLSAMKKGRESLDDITNSHRLKNDLSSLEEKVSSLKSENADLVAKNELLIKQ
mmetsp:Transcript_14758/g.22889  ORF Transcript_14758/g.22889 Transcript_14758/m.22889 type:complete len:89 (-) Transcript_14758:53-319(-)